MPFARPSGADVMTSSNIGNKSQGMGTMSTSLIMPTIPNGYPFNVSNLQTVPITTAAKIAKGHLTNSNVAYIDPQNYNGLPDESQTAITAAMTQRGYANNMRA